MRRRKVTYPPPKTATRKAPSPLGAAEPRTSVNRTVVSINTEAMRGRAEIGLGDRVRILSGLYEGELATVETVASGVIPAAMVRTDAGRTRRARTIDLEPLPPGSEAPRASDAPVEVAAVPDTRVEVDTPTDPVAEAPTRPTSKGAAIS